VNLTTLHFYLPGRPSNPAGCWPTALLYTILRYGGTGWREREREREHDREREREKRKRDTFTFSVVSEARVVI
jgi:hypothetical protein